MEKENYICRGCNRLDVTRRRCLKWGGRCDEESKKCVFYDDRPPTRQPGETRGRKHQG